MSSDTSIRDAKLRVFEVARQIDNIHARDAAADFSRVLDRLQHVIEQKAAAEVEHWKAHAERVEESCRRSLSELMTRRALQQDSAGPPPVDEPA